MEPQSTPLKLSRSASTPKDLQDEYEFYRNCRSPISCQFLFQEIPQGFLLDCLFEDLFSLIERSDPLPPDDRDIIFLLGILRAVSYLHSLGFAHLDIKPDNILTAGSGFPKLADFGLALRVLSDNGSIRSQWFLWFLSVCSSGNVSCNFPHWYVQVRFLEHGVNFICHVVWTFTFCLFFWGRTFVQPVEWA